MTKLLEKYDIKLPKNTPLLYHETNYQKAWEKLDKLSAKLRILWKTKKNSLQVLGEERAR